MHASHKGENNTLGIIKSVISNDDLQTMSVRRSVKHHNSVAMVISITVRKTDVNCEISHGNELIILY